MEGVWEMIKKLYYKLRWFPSRMLNRIQFKMKGIKTGYNVRTLGSIFIRGKGQIEIGDNVTINSCLEANPIGGDRKTIFYIKKGAELNIGSNVGISNTAFYSESSITIEDDVLIGNGCKIYDSNFHSTSYEQRVSGKEDVISRPVVIKRGAFIGGGVYCT